MKRKSSTAPGVNGSRFFWAAGGCFLLMALSWGLDGSISIVLAGAGCSFLFLGFWKGRALRSAAEQWTQPNQVDPESSILDEIEKGFKERKFRRTPILILVSSFVFFLFVVPAMMSDQSGESIGSKYQEMAEQFHVLGAYDSSDHYFQKALAVNSTDLEVLNAYGSRLMEREQYDDAMRQFERALTLDKNESFARFNKGLAHYQKGDYRKSLSEALQLMKRNTDYPAAFLLAGDSYYAQQRYDSALVWYEKGYRAGERSAALSYAMAVIYDLQHKTEKAVLFYEEALYYDEGRLDALDRLSEILPGEEGEAYKQRANALRIKLFQDNLDQ